MSGHKWRLAWPSGRNTLSDVRPIVMTAESHLGHNMAQRTEKDTYDVYAVVRARIDERIKGEAAAVLAAMGLTVSDAFRLLLTRVAREKALPFEPLIPHAETITAMKEARKGGLPSFNSVEELMADLDADN